MRSRTLTPWLVSLFALVLAATIVTGATAAGGVSLPGGRPSVSLGMLLRLHDLAPGYVIGDDEGVKCFRLDTEGADPPLAEYLSRFYPAECEAGYDRLYRVSGHGPDPHSVSSLAIDPGGREGMKAAEAVLPELVGRTLTGNIAPTEVQTRASLGAKTWLFHTPHGDALGKTVRGSLLVWRQGKLIGATLVAGAGAEGDRLVLRFARLQARRMRHPRPYPASARDDLLVPLDNPALKLPVYWLGRSFDPGGGERPLDLYSAAGPLREGEAPPGTRIELWYAEGALRIGTWTAATWKEYAATKLGRELLTWRCTRTADLALPAGGEATILRGYEKDYASCPKRPPSVTAAVVHAGGVVLGLNLPACYTCLETGLPPAELEAIVLGLRQRPQRRF